MRGWRRGLATAALVAGTVFPAGGVAGQDSDFVYVAIQGEAKVAVVDMATLEEVARIDLRDLGFSENAKPHHIAVEPDGSHWYLSLIGENRVLKFDRGNNLVGQAEFEVPGMLALDPNGDFLFVGRSMSAVNPPERIGAVDRNSMEVEEIDVFFPRPHALTVSADGERVYSASLAVNQLGAVDVESASMELTDIQGPVHTLVQFAASPDGSTLVATAELTGLLLVFDLADPDHPKLRAEVPVGRQPWHPVYSADGRTVFFGNKMDHTVVAVDVQAGRVAWRTEDMGLNHPHGSALSPDGTHLFISSNGPGGMQMGGMEPGEDAHAAHRAGTGTLTILDTRDGRVVKVLQMGENATGVGARRP